MNRIVKWTLGTALVGAVALGSGATATATSISADLYGAPDPDGNQFTAKMLSVGVGAHGTRIRADAASDHRIDLSLTHEQSLGPGIGPALGPVLGVQLVPDQEPNLYLGGRLGVTSGPLFGDVEADWFLGDGHLRGDARAGMMVGPIRLSLDYAVPLNEQTMNAGFSGGQVLFGVGVGL